MDFALTEEQLMMQESVEKLLSQQFSLEKLREIVAEGPAESTELWAALAAMGLCGLLVPEEYGGVGLTLLDTALVQELLARHLAPVAYTSSCVLAPLALLAAGSAEQKSRWLPSIASGEARWAVGLSEWVGARDDAGITASAGQLQGRALFVMGAADADYILLCSGDQKLYVVERGADGLERDELRTIDDTQSLCEFKLHGVAAEVLPDSDSSIVASLVDAARVQLAADTLGAAQKMLELAVAYAGERKQFGRLIGSFQAVKHLCAEMAAELEPSRSLVWYAAYAHAAVPEESSLMACHAKSQLAEVGRFVARTATEVHGGMGFTDLLGLHYWFKRIGCDRQLLGGPEQLRAQAAQLQGWC